MENQKIYSMSFAKIYPLLVNKAERKGRTEKEVTDMIHWLTGYDEEGIMNAVNNSISYEEFFKMAPKLNPNRKLIKGTICGVRIENIQEPMMREIRYLDKLIDELAKGRTLDKIFRSE